MNDVHELERESGWPSQQLSTPLLALWNNRRVVIRRQPDYWATIRALREAHTVTGLRQLSFHFEAVIPAFGADPCEITQDIWADIVWTLPSVTIVVNQAQATQPADRDNAGTAAILTIYNLTGRTHTRLPYIPNERVEALRIRMHAAEPSIPLYQQYLIFVERRLEDGHFLHEYGIQPGATIHMIQRLRGGKPVIYVMSPRPLENVSVTLALTPSWSFSASYPSVVVSHDIDGETVRWMVDVSPDGTLIEKSSGLRVSYLFWEAETHPAQPLSPASSRPSSPIRDTLAKFEPSRPTITPEDAVLLSVDKLPAYLDHALKALTLHTEARTSFITYWLPSLLKHRNVALRFLPQQAYEAAAPMNVSPAPDVVTRVFMLFRGVEETDLAMWTQARARADEDVAFWTEIVGVDVEEASDAQLYRVLEWGGMEVR